MRVQSRSTATVIRLAAPLKAWAQRFSFILLTLASITLMLVGKIDTVLIEAIRTRVVDVVSPILNALAAPASTVAEAVNAAADLRDVYEANRLLRAENEHLRQWHQVALRLDAENQSLRSLLNVNPDPAVAFITARVIAEPGGRFVRTVLVMAGERHGVRVGQAAMSGGGLVGRVVEVGQWASRILLLTDLNARIPVVIETSRHRAVIGGDNTDLPRLEHLSSDAAPVVGDRIVTAGTGGMFPPGLPVGAIISVGERNVRVQPFADLRRLDYVKIVDFGVPDTLSGLVRR